MVIQGETGRCEKVTKALVYAGKELQTRSYSSVIPWSDFGK